MGRKKSDREELHKNFLNNIPFLIQILAATIVDFILCKPYSLIKADQVLQDIMSAGFVKRKICGLSLTMMW